MANSIAGIPEAIERDVAIRIDGTELYGELRVPAGAEGVVLFAHGSGSSRHSPRNQYVAERIREAKVGTLLFDLLTRREEVVDAQTMHLRFDIGLLADRLVRATQAVEAWPDTSSLGVGYFGSSTGAGAALVAAAELGDRVEAVVSRGGRPDLAATALARVTAPTLLIVGGWDEMVIALNREAYGQLRCERRLVIVPRATHLFEEPGKLAEVANLAAEWFAQKLGPRRG